MDEKIITGYKVFNPDWTCRGKQYSCPGTFEEDVAPKVCQAGMHFCPKLIDCFSYYGFTPENHVAEVRALGTIDENGDDKICTNKLEVVRELSWYEVLDLINAGRQNTGIGNTGHRNTGDWNTGDWNTGVFNTKNPKMTFFNKKSAWTFEKWFDSKARKILSNMPPKIQWVGYEKMTEEEKKAHPESETTGGYLSEKDGTAEVNAWWAALPQEDKDEVLALPNFDKEIFKEITGIYIESGE